MKENLIGQIDSQQEKDVDLTNLDVALKSMEVSRYASDTKDRKWLAFWTALVVTLWLSAVLIILFYNQSLKLSDAVIISLLGTTTLNVLGLSFIVLKGHFKSLES